MDTRTIVNIINKLVWALCFNGAYYFHKVFVVVVSLDWETRVVVDVLSGTWVDQLYKLSVEIKGNRSWKQI